MDTSKWIWHLKRDLIQLLESDNKPSTKKSKFYKLYNDYEHLFLQSTYEVEKKEAREQALKAFQSGKINYYTSHNYTSSFFYLKDVTMVENGINFTIHLNNGNKIELNGKDFYYLNYVFFGY